MVTFSKEMIHDLILSFRRHTGSSDVPDRSRELDRRRRSLADGNRAPHHDPLRTRAVHVPALPGTDAIGRVVWESAARARELGGTVALAREDEDDEVSDRRPSHAIVSAWLAGLALWAIVLFLLSAE